MCFCQNGKIVLLQIAQSVVFKTTGPHRTKLHSTIQKPIHILKVSGILFFFKCSYIQEKNVSNSIILSYDKEQC